MLHCYSVSLQFEEQQAFERSRRFLRQLEISFGDNPSHYQKIIKALQTGPDLSPASIHEVRRRRISRVNPRQCCCTPNIHQGERPLQAVSM